MAILKTLDDLADFANYRKHLADALRALNDGDPVHVSKDEFEFEVKGSPWPGRVLLAGPSGDSSMTNLKRGGLQFKTASCRVDGSRILVEGLGGSFVKGANKTLDKLSLGFSLAVGGAGEQAETAEREEPEEREEREEQEEQEEPEDRGAERDEQRARKLKAKVHAELKDLLAANPHNRGDLARLVKVLGEHEKSAAWPQAVATLEELAEAIAEGQRALAAARSAEVEQGEEEAAAEADVGDARARQRLAATVARRKAAVLKLARAALAAKPELRGELGAALKDVERLEKAEDHEALLDLFDDVEELARADGDDEDATDSVLDDAEEFATFLRKRWKRMVTDPANPQPFYVSKNPHAFRTGDVGEAHLMLTGAKILPVVKLARSDGARILKGQAYREGKHVHLIDLPKRFVKLLRSSAMELGLNVRFVLDRADDAETEVGDEPQSGSDAYETYEARRRQLDGALRAALSGRRGDLNAIRIADEMATEAAANGDWPRAMQMVERLAVLLAAAGEQAPEEAVAEGTTAYRQRLVQFARTKSQVLAQLGRVTSEVSGVPGEQDLARELAAHLQDMFDAIGNAVDAALNASADAREPVNAGVRARIDDAIGQIETDELLAHVERNPWQVSIKAPLLTALRDIRAAMPA